MIKIQERQGDRITLELSGTLQKSDYEQLVPQLEKMITDHGKLRALVVLNDFDGWKPTALVEELKFDIRHRKDIEKCAIVGDSDTQRWLTKAAAPIFSGEVRYFAKTQTQEAESWLNAA